MEKHYSKYSLKEAEPRVYQPPKGLANWLPLKSTNGQNNLVLLVLFFFGAIFGIPEDAVTDIYLAAVPTLFLIVEAIKKAERPSWKGNLITYALSAVVLLVPALDGIITALGPIADELSEGNFELMSLLPLFIPLANQVIIYFRLRQNRAEEASIPAG